MSRKIFIIDIDRQSKRLMTNVLSSAGYEVSSSQSISESYHLISASSPDIVIIDPLYPKSEGINLIKSLREWTECPIIAVSANNTERAAIDILDAGADDYIRKPFFSGELAARVRSAIRHIELFDFARGVSSSPAYQSGDLRVEYDRRAVTVRGKSIHLTKNEFRLLTLLCKHSGKVLTYDYIIKSIWGPQTSGSNGILRVNVTNLRKKIEKDSLNPEYIFTENGVGYRIAENSRVNR